MIEIASTEITYVRPPITEAVIGITFSSPMDSKKLVRVNKALQKYYPHKQDVYTVNYSV